MPAVGTQMRPGCHCSRPGTFRGFRLQTAPDMCMCVCTRGMPVHVCAHLCMCLCACVHMCACVPVRVWMCGMPLLRRAPSKHSWDQTAIERPKERKGLCHGLRPQPAWALHPFLTGTLGASTPTQAPPLQRSQPGVPSPPCV